MLRHYTDLITHRRHEKKAHNTYKIFVHVYDDDDPRDEFRAPLHHHPTQLNSLFVRFMLVYVCPSVRMSTVLLQCGCYTAVMRHSNPDDPAVNSTALGRHGVHIVLASTPPTQPLAYICMQAWSMDPPMKCVISINNLQFSSRTIGCTAAYGHSLWLSSSK